MRNNNGRHKSRAVPIFLSGPESYVGDKCNAGIRCRNGIAINPRVLCPLGYYIVPSWEETNRYLDQSFRELRSIISQEHAVKHACIRLKKYSQYSHREITYQAVTSRGM